MSPLKLLVALVGRPFLLLRPCTFWRWHPATAKGFRPARTARSAKDVSSGSRLRWDGVPGVGPAGPTPTSVSSREDWSISTAPCLHPCRRQGRHGAWCWDRLGRGVPPGGPGLPRGGVIQIRRVEHTPAAVQGLLADIARLEPDAAEVRVVLETRHGVLVERLVDAGFVVLPVNPDLVARRRGPARKKDAAEDARIACLLALDRYASLRPLVPHGELAGELRSIARDDERAARDQRRLLNRLRQDLISTFPAALQIAGNDLGAPTILKLLQRWPTAQTLAAAPRHELVAFARAAHHGWPKRLAEQVAAALASDQFTPRDYLVRAKADSIRLGATQLLAIGDQRRTWQRRMGALL